MFSARLFGRRVFSAIPVWVGLSLLAFSLANIAPGDPAELLLRRQTGEPPSATEVMRLRHDMGLDLPFSARYVRWLGGAVRGDLGASYSSGAPVWRTIAANVPATLELALASLGIGLAVGLPLGVAAAINRGRAIDHYARFMALLATSIPAFVLGYLLMLLFAVTFQLFPVAGSGGWKFLVLPAATLGLAEGAAFTRVVRAAMLDVLSENYITTARAKGLTHRRVFIRHALRNALNPVVTLMGLRFGRLLGGAVIVEIVFAKAGLGTVIVDAIHDRDYSMIQGFVLFVGSVFIVVNLAVDMLYSRLDRRISMDTGERHRFASS